MKKIELENKLKRIDELKQKYYFETINLQQELKKIKQEIEKEKRDTKEAVYQCNQRADMIKLIIQILSGEANTDSKSQILRDMFLDEIKMIEEDRKKVPSHYTHITRLSNRFQEGYGVKF